MTTPPKSLDERIVTWHSINDKVEACEGDPVYCSDFINILIADRERLMAGLQWVRTYLEASKLDDHDHDVLNHLTKILEGKGGK